MVIQDLIYNDDGDPDLLYFEFVFEKFYAWFFGGLVEYSLKTIIDRGSLFLNHESIAIIFFITNRGKKYE